MSTDLEKSGNLKETSESQGRVANVEIGGGGGGGALRFTF